MKIVHLSDTHLGYPGHGLQRRVEDDRRPGLLIQQQEADLLARLEEAIDRIVDRVRPALVIHSGDLFDSARPSAYMHPAKA